MSKPHFDYESLLQEFLNGQRSVEEFQATYFDRYKKEVYLEEPLYELLEELFGDVDMYTTDQHLLAEHPEIYLDEAALRQRVRSALNRLSTLKG